MTTLNPIVSKFFLNNNTPTEIYYCPNTKTHAIVDLNILKDDFATNSNVIFALTTKSNINDLVSIDYFIKSIDLLGSNNAANISKIVVGKNERLYAKLISGNNVIIRTTGIEENNNKVLKAGKLLSTSVSGTSQTQIFINDTTGVSYTFTSLIIYNPSTTSNVEVTIWITTSTTTSNVDKILKLNIPSNETNIIENILLLPNERIFVQCSLGNIEFIGNGLVISS